MLEMFTPICRCSEQVRCPLFSLVLRVSPLSLRQPLTTSTHPTAILIRTVLPMRGSLAKCVCLWTDLWGLFSVTMDLNCTVLGVNLLTRCRIR